MNYTIPFLGGDNKKVEETDFQEKVKQNKCRIKYKLCLQFSVFLLLIIILDKCSPLSFKTNLHSDCRQYAKGVLVIYEHERGQHFSDTKYTSNNIEEAMAQHLCCSNDLSTT